MYKFKNFSESANRCINCAVDVASKLGHITVGSEHLLLSILSQGKTDAGDLLNEYGMDFAKTYTVTVNILGTGTTSFLSGEDLSTNAVAVLKNAFQIAIKNGRAQGGINEILMGILMVEPCLANKIITSLIPESAELLQKAKKLCEKMNTWELNGEKVQDAPKKEYKTLEKFSKNLTRMAQSSLFDPCIARDMEINRIIEILLRRQKNNPCLVGLAGVGKTAIVEGVANMIAQKTAPKEMWNKTIYALDMSQILAGTKYRGDFEERVKAIIDEASGDKDIILFIDEIHIITSAGGAEGAIDAANILKPALARGKIQVIGATTQDEYTKIIEKDSALERRFSKIQVDEPSTQTAIQILDGLKEKYEQHHHLTILPQAVEAAVRLSQRYIHTRYLPDKAVDLLDEACSCAKIAQKTEVGKEEVAKIVSRQTQIPVNQLTANEKEGLASLEKELSQMVLGQPRAIKAMANALKRWRIGLSEETRPIASFLFLGPTGVGKTQSCKALAQCLFHSQKAIVRIDCTEYTEKSDITKLIGSPPGYIGYNEGGKLEKELLLKPYSVVLFDEIEKAHPDLYNLLLQAMEDGFITSSSGKTISFRNTVIIMTSNLGAKEIAQKPIDLGFQTAKQDIQKATEKKLSGVIKQHFSPEFIGRIDEIITFNPLGQQQLKHIAGLMLDELANRLLKQEIAMEYTEALMDLICQNSLQSPYGARSVRVNITQMVENLLCDEMFSSNICAGDAIQVSVFEGQIKIEKLARIS